MTQKLSPPENCQICQSENDIEKGILCEHALVEFGPKGNRYLRFFPTFRPALFNGVHGREGDLASLPGLRVENLEAPL